MDYVRELIESLIMASWEMSTSTAASLVIAKFSARGQEYIAWLNPTRQEAWTISPRGLTPNVFYHHRLTIYTCAEWKKDGICAKTYWEMTADPKSEYYKPLSELWSIAHKAADQRRTELLLNPVEAFNF